jgi:hypothetical protein
VQAKDSKREISKKKEIFNEKETRLLFFLKEKIISES